MAALEAALPRQIPLHEQATDLTPATYNRSDDVSQDFVARAAASLDQREAITKSSRDARRKEIRESNYLRGL
jgi:large subunit ribosomal protein L54